MRKPTAIMATLLLWLLLMPAASLAELLLVPTDYPTIQSAIKDALPGDEVAVEDGLYSGFENINLDFLGKAITVTSASGPAMTTIDAGGIGFGVTFSSHEGRDSVIEGFTITNGNQGIYVYAVYDTEMTSPTIRGNVITSNNSSTNGGGIYCYYSGALIQQNVIGGDV